MGPESVLIFSLSILVTCGNSGVYANTVSARKNLHGDVKARPHLKSFSKNDNGPSEKEADPKAASIASVAADASLNITESMAKEISNAIALAVANAVAKVFNEQPAPSEQGSQKLSKDIPIGSDNVKANGNVTDNLKHINIEYRPLPIQKSQQKQSEVAFENDDNKSGSAYNTRKFSKTSDADQIGRRTFSDNQPLASDEDFQINPIANYRRSAITFLQHRNDSRSIYHEHRNARRHNHQFIDEKRDDDDDYDDDDDDDDDDAL